MEIHDGIVGTLVAIHHWICMKTHHQEVSLLPCLLQEIQVPHMEEVKCPSHIYYLVSWL